MKILVIGSGGREHALAWKLRESPLMEEIYCAPGNAGIAQEAECRPVDVSNPAQILELANEIKADLTVVGPEAPLVVGVVDEFRRAGRVIVGPTQAAARLEAARFFPSSSCNGTRSRPRGSRLPRVLSRPSWLSRSLAPRW